MIIETEHKTPVNAHVDPYECQGALVDVDHEMPMDFVDFLVIHVEIDDPTDAHVQQQNDLI
jgi:hypothetical protein